MFLNAILFHMATDQLQVDVYRNLGSKALVVMVLQYTLPAFGILFLSFLLIIIAPFLQTLAPSFSSPTAEKAVQVSEAFARAMESFGLAGLGIFVITFSCGFLIAWLKYTNYKFILHETALEIEQGIFYKDAVSIPYRSVQNVDIQRSLGYRLFGISKVIILTAGHEDFNDIDGQSEGIIPIMDKQEANELRQILLSRTHVQEVRHTADSNPDY